MKICVAIALGLGTMIGWKRIVVTVGEKIGKTHLTYGQGAAAELVAAATIGAADGFGLPVSTTHVLSSGVAGTMAANGSGMQWGTLRNIALAWVLTLPLRDDPVGRALRDLPQCLLSLRPHRRCSLSRRAARLRTLRRCLLRTHKRLRRFCEGKGGDKRAKNGQIARGKITRLTGLMPPKELANGRDAGRAPDAVDLLSVEGVTVRFGGVTALDGVSFRVGRRKQICGLIGPNGAGKTTLFNCISKLYSRALGDICSRVGPLLRKSRVHRIAKFRRRAHVPEPRAVRHHERARERARRRACAFARGGFLATRAGVAASARCERDIADSSPMR